ncbi:MAG: hypothetical protein CO189_03165 [candidate division Zixibacteria bacterium CG_4_9_14_3_um_filter_46_8]|nr:MAG: hypothetical protein CO189_03165 [candidate division Zixibacteria bacterium CG_4_9_14_3_um_filter_46_8]
MQNRHRGKKIGLVAPFEGSHHYSHLIKGTMENLGMQVIPVDYRADRGRLHVLLPALDVDAIIVNRGEGINPGLIHSLKPPTLLWYGEFIWSHDIDALRRRAEIEKLGAAFDYVVWEGHNEPRALQVLRNLNCSNVSYVYPVRLAPNIYRKLEVKKTIDVSFIGSLTPRRAEILDYLSKNCGAEIKRFSTYDLEEQVQIINKSRINLHINFAKFTTHSQVNLRVMDVLGCGGFCLSEAVEVEEMFRGGEHLAYFKANDLEDLLAKIEYYLANEKEREDIAIRGHEYFYKNYNMEDTVLSLLDKIDFETWQKEADPSEYGFGHDKFGVPTRNIVRFQNACRMMLDPLYPHHHHMLGYRLFELGLNESAISFCQRAFELSPERAEPLDILIRAYLKLGRPDDARKALNQISSISPDYAGIEELNRLLNVGNIQYAYS